MGFKVLYSYLAEREDLTMWPTLGRVSFKVLSLIDPNIP